MKLTRNKLRRIIKEEISLNEGTMGSSLFSWIISFYEDQIGYHIDKLAKKNFKKWKHSRTNIPGEGITTFTASSLDSNGNHISIVVQFFFPFEKYKDGFIVEVILGDSSYTNTTSLKCSMTERSTYIAERIVDNIQKMI